MVSKKQLEYLAVSRIKTWCIVGVFFAGVIGDATFTH
jgi:hypothetical protein